MTGSAIEDLAIIVLFVVSYIAAVLLGFYLSSGRG